MNIKFFNFPILLICRRLCWLYGSIFIMFMILIIRLIYLQIVSSNQLIEQGDKRSLRIQNIFEPRGMITDRMGRLLAFNIPVYSIWIDPQKIHDFGGICSDFLNWTRLSNILNIPLEKLLILLSDHKSDRFLYLSRHIDPVVADYISQLKLTGVYLQEGLKRYYPSGSASAHLVGITNIDNQGIEGIEKSFNSWLLGYPKRRVIRQDRLGRIIENVTVLHKGEPAQDVILSIDERLQYFAYHELNKAVNINQAESGSIVLIDIKTGEILAMANSPSYDPNNLSSINYNPSIMRNRAITDIFEPGSTVKPIVIMAALKSKIIDKDTILNTLPYMINGHQIKDVLNYRTLTIREILQKSSNVGVSRLALSMPISVLINSYLNFGIGKSTNIGLVGENKGKIYECNKYCSLIERAALAYGYGLMITPLQLAKIYATIGNMGFSRPISITRIDNFSSNVLLEKQIFSESLVRTVMDMMEITELSNHGCNRAAIRGYRVAVKTGTIKKINSCGKYVNKYISCIAGIAPLSNPRFALVVIINEPKNGCYYGGLVAAPVFKSVMRNALRVMNVSPDCFE